VSDATISRSAGVLEAVDDGELLRRVKEGAVTVLDVRPRDEVEAGQIPGAISMPLAELKKRLGALPKDRDAVAYCRGPYCVMALDAVEILRKKGFRAHRLEHGVAADLLDARSVDAWSLAGAIVLPAHTGDTVPST
jgi:rhodanese-related sulfurtransferase